ncbi:MAG: hypothetical protein ACOCWR_02305 [Oceanidesulfovibrio sp.]
MVVEFRVSCGSGDVFVYAINARSPVSIATNVQLHKGAPQTYFSCGRCDRSLDDCHLYFQLLPIARWFDGVYATRDVDLVCIRDGFHIQTTTSAQNACALLGLYAIFTSQCQYFQPFNSMFKYHRALLEPKSFIYAIISAKLWQCCVQNIHSDCAMLEATIKQFAHEFMHRINSIIDSMDDAIETDSVRGSLAILHGLGFLIKNFTDNYLEELKMEVAPGKTTH